MALREFRDVNGVEWRVWATVPAASALVRVNYGTLGSLEAGWLTFECAEGRKRLAPFPSDWDSLSDAELERWCSEAKAPPPRRSAQVAPSVRESAPSRVPIDATVLDPSAPARTFMGTAGRMWRVAEQERTLPRGSGDHDADRTATYFVLRFTSDSEALELCDYPMSWARLTDAQLLRLLIQAAPVRPD